MNMFKRTTVDPVTAAAIAEVRTLEARADIERARLAAQLQREQQVAEREARRAEELAAEEDGRRRQTIRRAQRETDRERRRVARTAFLTKLRPVLPLLLINGGAGYAQAAYAFEEIAPADWNTASKMAFALAFSAALESIAVYVQWHAHDALLLKAYATAAKLRRAAWVIAGVVAAINYAHFVKEVTTPTPAAVAFGLLSLLSPWLWGLHTRRAQHVQLLAEDANLIDDSGAEFSMERRRAFPIRSWQAKRWSIDHGVQDPREAWRGFNAERAAQQAEKATKPRRVRSGAAVRPAAPATSGRRRWRMVAGIRPRRLGRPAPQITVVLPDPKPTRAATTAPAKRATSAPSRGRPSKAQKVATFAARMPGAPAAEIAKRAGVSADTVRRHMATASTVNGHDHGSEK